MESTYNSMFLNKREVRQELSQLCRASGLTIRKHKEGRFAGMTVIRHKGSLILASNSERLLFEQWNQAEVDKVIELDLKRDAS
jgi:hypothetical protein